MKAPKLCFILLLAKALAIIANQAAAQSSLSSIPSQWTYPQSNIQITPPPQGYSGTGWPSQMAPPPSASGAALPNTLLDTKPRSSNQPSSSFNQLPEKYRWWMSQLYMNRLKNAFERPGSSIQEPSTVVREPGSSTRTLAVGAKPLPLSNPPGPDTVPRKPVGSAPSAPPASTEVAYSGIGARSVLPGAFQKRPVARFHEEVDENWNTVAIGEVIDLSAAEQRQIGVWTYFYPNGQVKEQGRFKKGERVGEWVRFNEDGGALPAIHYGPATTANTAEKNVPKDAVPGRPAQKVDAQTFPRGTPTEKDGEVISPYYPNNHVDVRGLPSGSLVLDPITQKVFVVP